jgi:DNA-binding transcriptional MerR regulator
MTVTLSELLALVHRLEGRTQSPRQIRYLESAGVLSPRGRTQAGVRLYDVADVALLRLVVQMRRQDIPLWVVKGILAHMGPSLRDVFVRRTDRAAIVEGPRMLIVKRMSAPPSRWTFDLKAMGAGATVAVRALRARRPELTWAGWHTMPAYRAAQLMEATA